MRRIVIAMLAELAAGASPADWRFAWPTLIPDITAEHEWKR